MVPFVHGAETKNCDGSSLEQIHLPKGMLQLEEVKGRKERRFNMLMSLQLVLATWQIKCWNRKMLIPWTHDNNMRKNIKDQPSLSGMDQ